MAETEGEKAVVYSVTSLTQEFKAYFEGRFSRITVEGEVSGFRRYPSGHCYFTLKDAEAQISAVMFKSAFERCADASRIQDGAKIRVRANATVYPPRGNYQLVILSARLAGEGDLMRQYLALKAKLEAEGLFDAAKKRPLPVMPRRIAVVTSEAGAVIHDMCTVLTRRFPALEIRLYPSLVQGEGAAATLTAGIRYFNDCADWKADLLILARGGGSFEDLFCFNDECLVRTLAASRIPTISAVGHETDFTLSDFAADRRAGTPSIAAEMAVPVLAEVREKLTDALTRLNRALSQRGEFYAQRLDHLGATLASALVNAEAAARLRLTRLGERLIPSIRLRHQALVARVEKAEARLIPSIRLRHQALVARVEKAEARLIPSIRLRHQALVARVEKAEARLKAYSPYGVLERGYSLTTRADGTLVREVCDVKAGDEIVTRLASGTFHSTVVSESA